MSRYPLVGILALLILLMYLHSLCMAQDCERPDTPAQAIECATLRLRAAEREIPPLVNELMQTDDKEFKEALAAAQDAWLKWREAEGRLAGLAASDKALAAAAQLTTEAQLTEDRVKDLRNMR